MFTDKHWKAFMWITIVFLIFSVALLANNIITTGSFLERDIDLSGGKLITVEVKDADIGKIKSAVPYANVRLTSGATRFLLVEMPFGADENDVLEQIRNIAVLQGEPSIRIVGPSIGNIFFQQAQTAMIAAFVLMAITVFMLFRAVVPSLIVLFAALTDILGTMAVLSIIDMPLSLPVIGALLALIGYSVSTDILLTTELLKSGRTDYSKSIRKAAKTGITLTGTALIALVCMFFLAGSTVIQQIALVMLIGLVIDMPATWFTNAGVLRLWIERKQRGAQR